MLLKKRTITTILCYVKWIEIHTEHISYNISIDSIKMPFNKQQHKLGARTHIHTRNIIDDVMKSKSVNEYSSGF